jgi:uncharacterized protein with HEPN domain
MGDKALVYKEKLIGNLNESQIHFQRLQNAIIALETKFKFPIEENHFQEILNSTEYLAYCDQIIYRFSKVQDCMGAKLFRSVLLYQGETVNKPFLDILNEMESLNIIHVNSWFEIRDLRNELAHTYDESSSTSTMLLNTIYSIVPDLKKILDAIIKLCGL